MLKFLNLQTFYFDMQKALFYKKEVRPYQKSKSSKNQNYKYIHSVLFQLPGR